MEDVNLIWFIYLVRFLDLLKVVLGALLVLLEDAIKELLNQRRVTEITSSIGSSHAQWISYPRWIPRSPRVLNHVKLCLSDCGIPDELILPLVLHLHVSGDGILHLLLGKCHLILRLLF